MRYLCHSARISGLSARVRQDAKYIGNLLHGAAVGAVASGPQQRPPVKFLPNGGSAIHNAMLDAVAAAESRFEGRHVGVAWCGWIV